MLTYNIMIAKGLTIFNKSAYLIWREDQSGRQMIPAFDAPLTVHCRAATVSAIDGAICYMREV